MTTQQPTKPAGWFSGRTRLITVVSMVAVSLAGATAVSANLGILDAASDSNVGTVSAAGDLTATSTSVIDVYLPNQASSTPAPESPGGAGTGVQEFTVDVAGTVAVAATESGLRLDSVSASSGWTWSLSQTSQSELMVTMTNGARTLEFVAATTADGNIAASVNEPIVTPAPPANGGGSDDEDDDDEYEGGDDDD